MFSYTNLSPKRTSADSSLPNPPFYQDLFKQTSYENTFSSKMSANAENLNTPDNQATANDVIADNPPAETSPHASPPSLPYKDCFLIMAIFVLICGLAAFFFTGNHLQATDRDAYCVKHIELIRMFDALTSTTFIGVVCCSLGVVRRVWFAKFQYTTSMGYGWDVLMCLIGIWVSICFSSAPSVDLFGCKFSSYSYD